MSSNGHQAPRAPSHGSPGAHRAAENQDLGVGQAGRVLTTWLGCGWLSGAGAGSFVLVCAADTLSGPRARRESWGIAGCTQFLGAQRGEHQLKE